MTDQEVRSTLLHYARMQWRMLAAALVSFILGAAVEPALPALFKVLLDSGFQEGLKYPLWLIPVVVIGLFVVRGFFNFAGAYAMNAASSNIVMHLRQALMAVVLRADSRFFHAITPGRVVTKLINDPQTASQRLSSAIISAIRDSATLLFLLAYLIYLNPQLTLLALISMPLLGFLIKNIQKRLKHVSKAQYDSRMKLVTAVENNARAWRVVRTFGAVQFELERFKAQTRHYRHMTMKQVTTSALITPLTQVLAAVGVSIILTLALWQASQGEATVGEFVSFITALLMIISPMRHLTDLVPTLTGAMTSARGAFEVLQAAPEPDQGTRTLTNCQGHVRFDQVTLKYEEAHTPALDQLTLEVPAGQTLALVGASGSGKSTVVSALLRFAYPQSGRITLDGIPIEDLTLDSLRSHFAVVSQDIVLFEGSIAQNVAYASPGGLNEERVMDCLKRANLWTHVQSLPEGMHSDVGTNGGKLSGGQRQRLAIARAMYRDAQVWIFDEATSALDSESEAVVQRSIDSLQHHKTLILIAHRLSTVRNADRICVLSGGRLLEQGTHEELLELGGTYADMVRIQSGQAH